MDATLNHDPDSFPGLGLMETFFQCYPPEKAEKLLWRWLLASIKNDFTGISESDFREFSDFFERLHKLEMVLHEQYKEQQMQLRKGDGL
ncbi:hypothetical protein [Desertivirga brevis]|uniref:hypothetical protein n=1 Tax=Desertivirga brevis TaxID=2810310 RepID=UPI001A96DC6B|nr:hypothetical protein [Pedobacter sp. SYSU D00873]